MSREEFIGKLQMVYVGDRNAIDELLGVYDNLKQKNQRLNNVLNELEKIIKSSYYKYNGEQINALQDVLNKLKELKESDK